jgi:Domain of unknown function (DUF222)
MFDKVTAQGLYGSVPVGAALEHQAPGGKLAAVIAGCDVTALSDYDLISYLSACERQTAWAQAAQLAAIAELDTRRTQGSDPIQRAKSAEWAAHEVAAELTLSRNGAEARVTLARSLRRLPDTAAMLSRGELDLAKTRAIVSALSVLDDDAAHAVEATVLGRAADQTSPQLGAVLRRAVIKADPSVAQTRHEAVVRDREVGYFPGDDGAATLWATGPATELQALYVAVTALADKAIASDREGQASDGGSDTTESVVRTLAQARFDVLTDAGLMHLNYSDLPRRQHRRPHLQVVVAATTLLGLDDDPAELVGHGPITAEMARAIAGDATWTRLLTDPVSGIVTDYGTTRYRPPVSLTDLVTAKHPTCRGLGCRQPASRCQIDHTIEFPHGPTAGHNLGPRCTHCHIHKHEAGWEVAQLLDGTFLYTAPSGHTYRREPDPPLLPNPPPDTADDDIPPF